MPLRTNLNHVLTAKDLESIIKAHENVMVCCGRMGPMCIPVYAAMYDLQNHYKHIYFADMEFDSPESDVIRALPECAGFMGLPFTVYFKKGQVVKATTSIQSTDQVKKILDEHLRNCN